MVTYSVHNLADEIFANEFEYDSGYAQFYFISGWLANNVGLLNNKIFTSCAAPSRGRRWFAYLYWIWLFLLSLRIS
jgi:hypothetical protein